MQLTEALNRIEESFNANINPIFNEAVLANVEGHEAFLEIITMTLSSLLKNG